MALTATQIVAAWRKFKEALKDAQRDVPAYHQLLARDYRNAYREITVSSKTLSDKILEAEKAGSLLFKKIKDYPKSTNEVDSIKKFKIIVVPYAITTLGRFIDFWTGPLDSSGNSQRGRGAKTLFEEAKKMREEMNMTSKQLAASSIGSGYSEIVKNSDSQSRSIIDALATGLSSSSINEGTILSSLEDSGVAERALAPIRTLLSIAANTEAKLYNFDTEKIQSKVDYEARFYEALRELSSSKFSTLSANRKQEIRSTILGTLSDAGVSSISFSKKKGGAGFSATLDASTDLDKLSKSLASQNIDKIKDFDIRAGKETIGSAARAAGVFAGSVEREGLSLKRSDIEMRSNQKYIRDLLGSVMVITKNGEGEETTQTVFSDTEKKIISELFYAGYVRIPKFEGVENRVYRPMDDADGQMTSLVRLRLPELISAKIVEKLQRYGSDAKFMSNSVDYLRGNRQVSVRDDLSSFAPGQTKKSLGEVAQELLYGITRDAFPHDHTTVMTARLKSSATVVLPDGAGNRIPVRLNHKSKYVTPNLSLSADVPEGDHIKGYNNSGTTVARNLLPLPPAVNQAKQDAETARDQLLLTVMLQNDVFGAENTENKWINDSLKITGMSDIRDSATELSEAAESSLSKYKNADGSYNGIYEEITGFNSEKRIYLALKSRAKTDLEEINNWMQDCLRTYEIVQDEYEEISSQLNLFEKTMKDLYSLSGTSSGEILAEKASKRAAASVAEMKAQASLLLNDVQAIENYTKKVGTDNKIRNAARSGVIAPYVKDLRVALSKHYGVKVEGVGSTAVDNMDGNSYTYIFKFDPIILKPKGAKYIFNPSSHAKINNKTVVSKYNYSPANGPWRSLEIEIDLSEIDKIAGSQAEKIKVFTNANASDRKIMKSMSDSYDSMIKASDQLQSDILSTQSDSIRYLEKLRGYLTAIVQREEKKIKQIREQNLDLIYQKIMNLGLSSFASIFQDLKRGEQKWRQARSVDGVRRVISDAIKSSGSNYIEDNISIYEKAVNHLKGERGAIKEFQNLVYDAGDSHSSDSIESLVEFSRTLVDLLEQNKFALFSEYFE
jgi:hypothetical protein